MRNPKRIPSVLKKLRKYWELHPDLRLGQLLMNIASVATIDLFYIEDTHLIEQVNILLEDRE